MSLRLLPLVFVLLLASIFAADASAPVKLIFDTDIGNDCDDALALAVIHALQNRGACELRAVTLTNSDPKAGELVDAINTFYGRPGIPIGINPDAPRVHAVSKYLKAADQYPHRFDATQAPRALRLLRQTLAAAVDGEMVIVQVGFFTNLAALLDSPPDEFSPLNGKDLVARKVQRLSLMGGAFAAVRDNNYTLEFNVRYDIPAARKVADAWPTPIVWSGAEIGEAITFPAVVIDRDLGVKPNPIRDSYQLYKPTPHERPCYDLTSVLEAVWPDRGYFTLSGTGRVEIQADSFSKFKPAPATKPGRDRYLIVDATKAQRVRELFGALVSELPSHP